MDALGFDVHECLRSFMRVELVSPSIPFCGRTSLGVSCSHLLHGLWSFCVFGTSSARVEICGMFRVRLSPLIEMAITNKSADDETASSQVNYVSFNEPSSALLLHAQH